MIRHIAQGIILLFLLAGTISATRKQKRWTVRLAIVVGVLAYVALLAVGGLLGH